MRETGPKRSSESKRPWFFGSKEGISGDVLPPWTPLRVEWKTNSADVYPWGRKYTLGPTIFPSKILSKDRSILSRPIQVVARVEGEEVRWEGTPISLEEETPSRVAFFQKAVSDTLFLSARTEVEYDGMIRIDWKIEPRRRTSLDELTFEMALKREHARYLYHFPGGWGTAYNAGALPEEGFVDGFRPFIWLGDEERGLAWFSESDKNWYNKDGENVTEIIPEGDNVVLRLRLVGVPLELSPGGKVSEDEKMVPLEEGPLGGLAYTFGFQATPVKPVTKDVWDYRIFHIGQKTFGVKTRLNVPEWALDRLAELGVKTIAFHEHWTDVEAYFDTAYGEDLKRLVKACHERGIQLLLYFGFLISDLAPEWPLLGEECVVLPKGGYTPYNYPPQPIQNAYRVCYKSVWQDAVVAGIARLIDEYGIDGVYLDGTEYPWPCSNRAHGCGYIRPDGSVASTYPIFAVRNLMRRIYTVVKKRRPEGQINVHNSTCMTIPTLEWATSYWDGEQFGSIEPGPHALEVLPLDAFRTEFMGHQWGVPAEFLCYDRPFTWQEAYAFTLLHDILIRSSNLDERLELESQLWRLNDEFGRKEALWLPYWKNAEYVTVKPTGAYTSLYWHPKNGVLAVISNLTGQKTRVEVKFNLDKLNLSGKEISGQDALTGESIKVRDGKVQLVLPSMGWRLVWLKH